MEKRIKDDSFYSFPTEEIVRIFEKSRINDQKLLMELQGMPDMYLRCLTLKNVSQSTTINPKSI